MKTKVAILGATSHIAKGLIHNFCLAPAKYELSLFARSVDRVQQFLRSVDCSDKASAHDIETFSGGVYDVVINCVGIGNPAVLKNAASSIFSLTEQFDKLILDHLETNPRTLYINFSSGAVYGKGFMVAASDATPAVIDVNHIVPEDYYTIAKIYSEAKHRAQGAFKIVDLRVFAYFSRFVDIEVHYFMTELISCLLENRELITTPSDMTRDFIHPYDLFSLVEKCIEAEPLNDAFDVYSLRPVTKFEILEHFARSYGLKYVIKDDFKSSSATGSKSNYYSTNKRAVQLGYEPTWTSLEAIVQESDHILKQQ